MSQAHPQELNACQSVAAALPRAATIRRATVRKSSGPELTAANLPDFIETHVGTIHNVEISRELARELLKHNNHNRPIRVGRVNHFIALINRGEWVNTGEPIIFSKRGLNEGQHRLSAIVEADVSVTADVRFGVDDTAFVVTGTGATRSAGDLLGIAGIPNGRNVAAGIKLLLNYDSRAFNTERTRNVITNAEVLEAIERWPDFTAAFAFSTRRFSGQRHHSPVGVFTFLALRHKNEATVGEFLEAVATGVVNDKRDPARLLRERMLLDPQLRINRADVGVARLALIIVAWRLWLNGARQSRLTIPAIFPYLDEVTL